MEIEIQILLSTFSNLGHPGKDPGHGVDPVLGVLVGELQHLGAVCGELATEEVVREYDLENKDNFRENYHPNRALPL